MNSFRVGLLWGFNPRNTSEVKYVSADAGLQLYTTRVCKKKNFIRNS